MSSLSTLPKGDSAWLLRKAIERIIQQVSVLETNIGSSTTGNSANTQVIFNDNGTLRGDPDLTFNTALNKLVATNLESTTTLVVGTTATITGAATVGTTLGVTGVSTFAAGTALLPAITTTGDTNTGIYYPAADTLAITTGGTERWRVNSSGIVGIGVTPSAWQSGLTALQFAANGVLYGNGTNGSFFGNNYYTNSSGDNKYILTNYATAYGQVSGAHQWFNAPIGTAGNTITFTQAMTLTATGALLVGATSALAAWATRLTLSTDAGTTKWAVGPYAAATNFIISADGGYGVYLNGTTATSWTGISDERLKDIIEPISNAVAKVGQLRSVIGKFKSDETNTRRSFLIAQDVQAVLPEAVDASNPDRLGVAYTEVIPLLVAAIKELTARVQTLEAK